MHRLIARLLVLVALLGNIGPAALAAASHAHACCVRKAAHSCHRPPLADTGVLVVKAADCCNQGCGRAVISLRWTATPLQGRDSLTPKIEPHLDQVNLGSESIASFRLSHPRAPPAC